MKPTALAAFDFDGTITHCDTLIRFIAFAKGNRALYGWLLLHSFQLVAMKLGFFSNEKLKQKMFARFFRQMTANDFDQLCRRFFAESKSIIRPAAKKAIEDHLAKGDTVVIISASIDNWVIPFARYLGIETVIGTQVEYDASDCLTGAFLTSNCYGEEKVKRLLQIFPDRKSYHLTAYGDSRGDKPLLDFADKAFYRHF